MTRSFLSPFILQTFASHLTALVPIENIPDLYEGYTAMPPFGALVLTVTAVQLTLIYTCMHCY